MIGCSITRLVFGELDVSLSSEGELTLNEFVEGTLLRADG